MFHLGTAIRGTTAGLYLTFLFGILSPVGLHAEPGYLYQANQDYSQVTELFPSGTNWYEFVSGVGSPQGIAFDTNGNLFIAGAGTPGNGAVYKCSPDGSQVVVFASGLGFCAGIALDNAGNIFVSDFDSNEIYKYSPSGTRTTFATGLNSPAGLAFDRSGNLFEADFGSGVIFKFTPAGAWSIFASGLLGPAGLAFDAAGNLFVSEAITNHYGVIDKFTASGAKSIFASGLSVPLGLAFDNVGNLFEVDNGTATIYSFAPNGTKSVFFTDLSGPTFIAFQPAVQKLRNISTRALVLTGENVLIGGFIVGGNALFTNAVVARAIGPSLSDAGIANPLQDPVLELHDSSGALVASNDNWQDTQAAQISTTGLAPTDPRESAILIRLATGSYTVIVRGTGNSTGVALVEVYNLLQQ